MYDVKKSWAIAWCGDMFKDGVDRVGCAGDTEFTTDKFTIKELTEMAKGDAEYCDELRECGFAKRDIPAVTKGDAYFK